MFLSLERCLLAPRLPGESNKLRSRIEARLDIIRHGRQFELQLLADGLIGRLPSTEIVHPTAEQQARAAILAINDDELSRAAAAIDSSPIATNSDHNINIIRSLYPPKTPYESSHRRTRHNPTISRDDPHAKSVTSEYDIHNTLRSLPKGTGAGPGADSIDFLRAAMTQEVGNSVPGLQLLSLTFDILLHGNLPKSIRPFFADNFSMILHKDLKNLDKLRPIGIFFPFIQSFNRYYFWNEKPTPRSSPCVNL